VASQAHIPDKLYYRIKEVTEITGLAAYVLRFWESEFSVIRPRRSESGQRLYRRTDIEAILEIKHLLYEKKFTIEGARKHLKKRGSHGSRNARDPLIEQIRAELRAIRNMLDE